MIRLRTTTSKFATLKQTRLKVKMQQQTVAVIGAGECIPAAVVGLLMLTPTGSSGLSMLKTLREDGFKVTCYERRSQVGGLWAYTDDKSMTTALPSENPAVYDMLSSS